MGCSPAQLADLQASIAATPAELVLSGTPIALADLIEPGQPVVRVRYDLAEIEGEPSLGALLDGWLAASAAR